jgi:hypothetical protein
MLVGAGLARVWHHSRAHRFFATARWNTDAVGLTVLRLILGHLLPVGAPLVVAIDDTMFRRCGRKVHAAHWGYDGSFKVAKGNKQISRGNNFIVAVAVIHLPSLDRPIALPVLTRLWRKGGPTKTALARELIEVLAAARGRIVHVVADGAYICTELRRLPPQVTLTGSPPRLTGGEPLIDPLFCETYRGRRPTYLSASTIGSGESGCRVRPCNRRSARSAGA